MTAFPSLNALAPETPDLAAIRPNALLLIAAIEAGTRLRGDAQVRVSRITAMLEREIETFGRWYRTLPGIRGYVLRPDTVHCRLTGAGIAVARMLRTARPERPPPPACGCDAPLLSRHHDRALYACGLVRQWCATRLPGRPRAPMSNRTAAAQHGGTWFAPVGCGGFAQTRWATHRARLPVMLHGGAVAETGLRVERRDGNSMFAGRLLDAAAGTALVEWNWPDPLLAADIVPSASLMAEAPVYA